MNEIQTFQNEEFGLIRAASIDGEPWFVAKDVCNTLGVGTNHLREAGRGLDEDEVASLPNWEGRGSAPLIISEPGFYKLVMRSRKPEAKAFQRWVTHEVLPSIRLKGGYMVAGRDETPEQTIARALVLAKEALDRKDAQIAEMAPKALFADAVAASDSSILVGDLAKLIKQNGVDIGQRRLFQWMRDEGWLMKSGSSRNMPTQRGMERGLFEVKERTITNPDGSVRITRTTKVTGKGQEFFVNLFLGGD
ncbi:phage antirepressor [Candidatus Collinsella stercoripullorum]|uniref:phage antirepressor n=1 Tax=Candidatus Collinsella stercoripullorum TaxID=2838522 RepID=UPI0022E70770|nr:phage antirepressor KilAC domain-containing protein [Candidatus Collinsella stercoripullorum]